MRSRWLNLVLLRAADHRLAERPRHAETSIVMELTCGACHGRLLVESPGMTVGCPHCGTIVSFPGPADDEFGKLPAATAVAVDAGTDFGVERGAVDGVGGGATDAALGEADGASSLPPAVDAAAPFFLPAPAALTGADCDAGAPSALVTAATDTGARGGVSPVLFLLVLSYASAMTLVCLYLGWLVISSPSPLDLPDLAPPHEMTQKITTLIYLPPEKQVPAAYSLRLGQTRRFGSLKVTPLRVTRGPVQFSFYNPEAGESRAPEGPVLKLFVRFDNVSNDQEFVPVDRRLVFTKEPDKKNLGVYKANNFVCNVGDRARLASHVFVFDLSPDSAWLMQGQDLDRELKPGEAFDTFIATTPEKIESLSGPLVWRVHFREGYNRASLRGVTTLIEVLFGSSDIIDEEPAPEDNLKPSTKDV